MNNEDRIGFDWVLIVSLISFLVIGAVAYGNEAKVNAGPSGWEQTK